MAHAGSNSGGRLAVLYFRKRSRRGWIVLTISSKSLPSFESLGNPKRTIREGKDKLAEEEYTTNPSQRNRTMQDCFRQHPDIYGSELEEDDDAPPDDQDALFPPDPSDAPIPSSATSAIPDSHPPPPPSSTTNPSTSRPATGSDTDRARAAKQQVERDHGEPMSESEEVVPKAAHDATAANAAK